MWGDTKRTNRRTGKEVNIIDNSQVFIVHFDNPVPVQETLNLFRSLSIVEYAEEPAIICLFDEPNDEYYRDAQNNVQWYFEAIQADDAWDITHGSDDIVIGIIDNGFYPNHPDITNKVISSDGDSENHGTEVASVAAASTNNSIDVASLGWNTKLRLYDGINQTVGGESTTASKITAAAHYCDIINMSFGIFRYVTLADLYEMAYYCPKKDKWVGSLITTNNSSISSAISNAISQGVICIAAAGNGTKNTGLPYPELCDLNAVPYTAYPAAYQDVIAVSGTTLDESTEVFNTNWNYGSFVDISAPGTGIKLATSNNSDTTKSGTSYSSPLVAALVSLILAFDPNEDAEDIIKSSADKIDSWPYSNGWNSRLGYGRINAYDALLACFPQIPTGFSLSGSVGQYPTLNWNSNTENDLDGYLLYRKIGSGNEYSIANLNEDVTSFVDHGVIIGNGKFDPIVRYRLSAYDLVDNESEKTSYVSTKAGGINKPIVNSNNEILPTEFNLYSAYPNPFNSSTVFKYDIPKQSIV
ncbi:MAG: S8 family serine peptidase [Bacteroidales bacterium]